MFSSKTGEWDTPQSLIDDLKTVFDFDIDVCADRPNVCDFYYNEDEDGLSQEWNGLAWMNPPYGRNFGDWVKKARYQNTKNNCTVVCLLPSRTDTRWWHDNVKYASVIVLMKGRLKFGEATNSAPFPSALVVFGELTINQYLKLAEYGMVVRIV